MKVKPHDKIFVKAEIRKSGYKYILTKPPEVLESVFEIECQVINSNDEEIVICIPDDFVGWNVSSFYTTNADYDQRYLNKKFWTIEPRHVLRVSLAH